MKAVDLNLANPALGKKARELGWGAALAARIVLVEKSTDIPFTPSREIVSAESGDDGLLRTAAESPGVDLINPVACKDFYKNDGLIRAVAGAGKAFEIPLAPLLGKEFVHRAKLIMQVKEFLRRCLRLGAAFVFTSRAGTEFDLKSPRETLALIQLLGLSGQQALYAITKAPERILRTKNP